MWVASAVRGMVQFALNASSPWLSFLQAAAIQGLMNRDRPAGLPAGTRTGDINYRIATASFLVARCFGAAAGDEALVFIRRSN